MVTRHEVSNTKYIRTHIWHSHMKYIPGNDVRHLNRENLGRIDNFHDHLIQRSLCDFAKDGVATRRNAIHDISKSSSVRTCTLITSEPTLA